MTRGVLQKAPAMESIFSKVAGPSCFFTLNFAFLQNQQPELLYEESYS